MLLKGDSGLRWSAIIRSTSEEAAIVLDGFDMSYPEHFDWLKDTINLAPGKSCLLMG